MSFFKWHGKKDQSDWIRNMGILDLRNNADPEELHKISGIRNVGLLILAENPSPEVAGAIAAIPKRNIGNTLRLPASAEVRSFNGITIFDRTNFDAMNDGDVLVINGVALAMQLSKEKMLSVIVNGVFVINTRCEIENSLNFIAVNGELCRLNFDENKVVFYQSGMELGAETISYFEEGTTIISSGELKLKKEITSAMLSEKQINIISCGALSCGSDAEGYVKAKALVIGELEIK